MLFLSKVKTWTVATRAETLVASISPIAIGACIVSTHTQLNISIFILTVLYGLFLHIGTNLSNDYYDFLKGADTEKRIAAFSSIQLKLTSLKQIKTAYTISFALAFIIGLYFVYIGGLLVLLLFTLPIFFGYFYTAGKKPLGYIGLGDILVLIFFGPFATLGTYYLQTLKISYLPILAGLAPGFLSTAILIVNNLRDIEVDRPANKKTLAVKMGKRFSQIEYFLCLFLTFIIPLLYYSITKKPFLLISSLTVFLAPFFLILKFKNPSQLNDGLKKTVLVLVIYTIVFCLGLFF